MSLGEALAEAYGLQLVEAHSIDYGMWEEAFRIETDQGRFFAKRILRKDRKSGEMIRGLELSQQLREQGFPAPVVLRARSGSLLVEHGGERYLVTEWVEGRTYRPGQLPKQAAEAMGGLLGRFHRMTAAEWQPDWGGGAFSSPVDAATGCRALLERYADRSEPFAAVAREVLAAQLDALAEVPADLHLRLPHPRLGGPCFNSYWAEQLLFDPACEVAALVDWTDGAGKPGHWVSDLALGIHLSALDLEHAVAFAGAYQAENPLPEGEWRALAARLCYGHLASTNFLGGWFARPYRRMADWEETSAVWHRQIVPRFREWAEWEEALVRIG